MYYLIVAAFMLVLPVASITIDAAHAHIPLGAAAILKWFAFWTVGGRLFLAGCRQVVQPAYTARTILGLTSDDALILVRELGFANLAVGLLGLLSLRIPAWQPAAALTGGVFYALAGLNHIRQPHRNQPETVAMISDLFAAVVLLGTTLSLMAGR